MTSRIASAGGSPPRRALMQPALPTVSITQPTGRCMSAKAASNDADKSEVAGASGNDSAANLNTATPTIEALIVDGSRRISILPRSASMGNIASLRSAAGSRASDRPKASHSAMQSISIEDPFLSPDKTRPALPATPISPPEQDRVHAILAIKTPEQDLSPRQDRLGQEVTPANAQGVHIPAACVFMANLSSQRTLDQLEYSVSEAMRIYGKCYIKVQFDKNKMPYAFVQFEKEEEARLCLTNARGLVIDGRPIRVEHAKAHRSVYLTKVTGGPVSDEEARNVLGCFGAIEETCQTTVADQEMHGLPEGCWVKFRYFMDCKDAIGSFRHNEHYRLVVKVQEEAGRVSSISPSLNRGPNRGSRHGSDAKAIFVGGLPETVAEEQLLEVFRPYGAIADCKIIRKALGGNQMNVFAFIEFMTTAEAQGAQGAQLTVLGIPLRVEPKRYTMRRAARNNMNQSPNAFSNTGYKSPYQSPAYHTNDGRNQYNNGYATVYNQGPPIGFASTQSPHVVPIRGSPLPQYGNSSNMSPYTQYPSPHYTSPLAPRGYDMSSPSPMYHGGPTAAPPYYGPYMVGGSSNYNTSTGPGQMQPIAEHEGEMGGSGGF